MPEPFVMVVSPEITEVEQAIAQSWIDEPEPFDMGEIDPRVLRGARFLDVRIPGWALMIDLDRFDIGDGDRCVLGQTIPGGYTEGLRRLWGDIKEVEAAQHGFTTFNKDDSDWDLLERDWRIVIGERQKTVSAA